MRHYTFSRNDFEEIVAHDGKGLIRTIRVEQGGGVGTINFVDLTILPAGTSIGQHTHELDNEEIYIVIAGQGTMEVDRSRFEVEPGDVIVNNAGGTHSLENSGSSDLLLVVIEVKTPRRSQL